ncbi:MAG: lysophospholipid acyltransferase family protein [Myxococcota bacterium]
MTDEPLTRRWGRRFGSVGAHVVASVMLFTLLPVLLPLALSVDLVRGARLGTTRFLAMMLVYLVCEQLGVLASAGLWVTHVTTGRDRTRWLERNFRLQCWWAGTLFRAGERLFDLRVAVEGVDCAAPGPILLLVRHASVADTLLPAVFVSTRLGIRLRYVLKRELLWDPCLDIVGQRLPNVFVRRGSRDPARELANVRALATNLGPTDGALLFPEGTRFSPRRRAEALARLSAGGDPALAVRAAGLTHVLPPRLGGTLALLDAAPDADVVFCGHVGFDGALRLGDLWNGALVGRSVRVVFWRCPRASIPADRDARVDWLYREWERLDAWVAATDGRGEETAGARRMLAR